MVTDGSNNCKNSKKSWYVNSSKNNKSSRIDTILYNRELEHRKRREQHGPRTGGNTSGREDSRDNNKSRDANNSRDHDNIWEPKNANDSNNIANRRVNSEGEKTRASR